MTAHLPVDGAVLRIRPLSLLGTAAGSAVLVIALRELGAGQLAPPPIHAWSALTQWYETTPPEVALISLLRCVAMLLACWLSVAAALQLLSALPVLRPLGRLADRISPRSWQRFGHGLAGLSLTAGLAAAVPGAGIPLVADGRSISLVAPDDDPARPPASDEPGTATLRVVDDVAAPPAPVRAPAPRAEVTVEVGDSLWSIAADVLADRTGAPPVDRQVVPYWRALIEHNRTALVDPGNPDLIFPGQVFTLPPS